MITNMLTLKGDATPVKLRQISSPPKQLFTRGDIDILKQNPSISVVGSRKITPYGKEVTESIVNGLVDAGFVIISGLALGVDAAAHKAALDREGKTIAVLPTPVDSINPQRNYRLGEQIAQKGLLISEYQSGTAPQKHFFAERNRLVSGLSDAVLIIQASEKSGTLITANHAKEQGKKLFVVPGEITTRAYFGNNRLIRDGATLIRSANDIISDFGLKYRQEQGRAIADPIIKLMDEGMVDSNEIQTRLKLSTEEFNQKITMLEIEGKVKSKGNGTWFSTM